MLWLPEYIPLLDEDNEGSLMNGYTGRHRLEVQASLSGFDGVEAEMPSA